MVNPELAVASIHKICKKAGRQVSEAAAEELSEVLSDTGVKIAKEAIDYAMHARRKTLKAEGIEIATRQVLGKQNSNSECASGALSCAHIENTCV